MQEKFVSPDEFGGCCLFLLAKNKMCDDMQCMRLSIWMATVRQSVENFPIFTCCGICKKVAAVPTVFVTEIEHWKRLSLVTKWVGRSDQQWLIHSHTHTLSVDVELFKQGLCLASRGHCPVIFNVILNNNECHRMTKDAKYSGAEEYFLKQHKYDE